MRRHGLHIITITFHIKILHNHAVLQKKHYSEPALHILYKCCSKTTAESPACGLLLSPEYSLLTSRRMSGTCDSSPDLPCCFLPHLYRGLFAVPSSMRGTNQIWCILQRTLTKTEGKRNKIIAKFQVCTCIIRNAFRGGGIGVNY